MEKLCGIVMILSAGGWAICYYFRQYHRKEEALNELIAALEQVVTDIRWQHRRLPDIFRELQRLSYCGELFTVLYDEIGKGESLYDTWLRAISCLPEEQKRVLQGVHLSGDEKHLTNSLLYAAQQLKGQLRELEDRRAEKGKVATALICCGVGMLLIILM